MSEVVLYTTHCSKCRVLEQKLENKKIKYISVDNTKEITDLGIVSVPVLKVCENLLNFTEANKWINDYNEA